LAGARQAGLEVLDNSNVMKKIIIITTSIIISALAGWGFYSFRQGVVGEPIKAGILHSITGTMAISEKSVLDSTLMAIEEINLKGGL
jgi:urea transport system substrate-binding protein